MIDLAADEAFRAQESRMRMRHRTQLLWVLVGVCVVASTLIWALWVERRASAGVRRRVRREVSMRFVHDLGADRARRHAAVSGLSA